ncbi:hypothetical protein BRARA_B02728 [Brassica rapa]|uniref:Replication factor A C-terminal domain-containing protein n=1 Tax=Brassica campestris TaxID=3711 RepID=A0A398AD46_BRACM|nr:hypothetical protein BRARA_B02728 [Brassica rapa]
MPPKAKSFVSDIKPWKTKLRVHVKVVHSWKQQSKFDVKIETSFLSLASFTSINNGDLDPDFLIDVFGQVVDIGDMLTIQVSGEERKKCEFYLKDTSGHTIQCCLWGRFAEQFQESCQEADKQIILCLIRFAKITSYRGELQVTNSFDASDVKINPSIPESDEYMKLLSQDDMSLTTTGLDVTKKKLRRKREVWLTYPVKTVAEMIHAKEIEKCRITATIYGNDTDWAWFYFGCCQCTKKVTRIRREIFFANSTKPLWRCDTCHENVSNVEPKFKLHILVKDNNNNTKMLLLDSEAQKVVCCMAKDGSYNEMEDPELLPVEIAGAVGKTFHFGVQINKDNVSYELAKIEAEAAEADACETEEQESDEPVINMSSTKLSDNVSIQSEISSKDISYGLSTPSSKRKEEIDVLPDLNSTTKKQCTKLIKLEKDNLK